MPHSSMFVPRQPTSSEIEDLKDLLLDRVGLAVFEDDEPEKQTDDYLAQSVIAVFDNTKHVREGYGNKIMMVVYPNDFGYFEVFTWDESRQIKPVKRHEDISDYYM